MNPLNHSSSAAASSSSSCKTEDASSSSHPQAQAQAVNPADGAAASFPDEVLEHVLAFITSHRDRNAVSLVCKAWLRADKWSRRSVYVGNCYSCTPEIVSERFPRVKALTLKGKPRFSDFNLVPPSWGADVLPWVRQLAMKVVSLEELRLKRMTVSDESLALISHRFPNFRVLVLTFCEGFSTDGLRAIASNCRHLAELDLQECIVDEKDGDWLSAFPESFTSLTSLNLTSFSCELNFEDLEHLVYRCSHLEKLKLNRCMTLDQLRRLLLLRGTNLTELGTGCFIQDVNSAGMDQVSAVFRRCKNMVALSGFWEVVPLYLPLIYPICHGLKSLNLSDSPIGCSEFIKLISQCHLLECLWVQDLVEDRGLEAVAASCKNLRELRVVPCDPSPAGARSLVTEKGMVAISRCCNELRYILFFCNQMTNSALEEFASNCRDMTHFRLCIMKPWEPDYVTKEPMDEGFGAIVRYCRQLRRLSVSGWLTDRAFELIGKHAKEMRSLSLAFVGNSGMAMYHLMHGCESLKKLEIRDCPFGDDGLLSGAHRYYNMRSLWMSACDVSLKACKALAEKMPFLNVEMIVEDETDFANGVQKSHSNGSLVEKLYLYRTVAGPRPDAPSCVYTF